jgi:hypothetical protein
VSRRPRRYGRLLTERGQSAVILLGAWAVTLTLALRVFTH